MMALRIFVIDLGSYHLWAAFSEEVSYSIIEIETSKICKPVRDGKVLSLEIYY
jgi:hypothetical protein